VDGIRALEDAGAAAVVMPSLFEEQIRAEDTAYALYTDHGSYSQSEAGSYFPQMPDYYSGVAAHLDTLRRAVAAVDIPVIASLNAVSVGGWITAARLEQAGAAALELNVALHPDRRDDERPGTSKRITSKRCVR
jgi:dihydroorotate dehydrogenase (fumarate)